MVDTIFSNLITDLAYKQGDHQTIASILAVHFMLNTPSRRIGSWLIKMSYVFNNFEDPDFHDYYNRLTTRWSLNLAKREGGKNLMYLSQIA